MSGVEVGLDDALDGGRPASESAGLRHPPIVPVPLVYTHGDRLPFMTLGPGTLSGRLASRRRCRVPGAAVAKIDHRIAPLATRSRSSLWFTTRRTSMRSPSFALRGGALDPDTAAVEGSGRRRSARRCRACGGNRDPSGRVPAAFLAVRPRVIMPTRRARFCLFNNVAVLAENLTRQGQRVAIVDWDVHHGDGTQDTFYQRQDVLYVSLHEFPFLPGEVGGSTKWDQVTGWVTP